MTRVKLLGACLGVVVGLVVGLWPLEGLSPQAVHTLGILAWAIVWWVFGVLPELITAVIMAVLFLVVGAIPAQAVFEPFSGPTWWLLFAAFGLGLGMKCSGLVERMAHAVLDRFSRAFPSQVFALMAAGTVVGPFIPSMTAKLAVLAPLAQGMSDSLGYPRKSRGANGLFLAALVGVRNLGPAVISASIIGYALLALYPEQVRAHFDMVTWFLSALPWFLVVSGLNFLAIVLLYRPKDECGNAPAEPKPASPEPSEPAVPAGSGAPGAPDTAPAEPSASAAAPTATKRTPMSSGEKKMLVIILVTVLLWALEPLHGVAASTVALAGLCACLATGVMDLETFRTGLNWESLFFIGIVMGLASVFAYTGLDAWVVALFGPMVSGLAFSPYAFVLGVALLTVALRFIIVSEMAFVNIFMVFIMPVAMSFGINPWVVGFVIYAMVNPWFARYQNPVYLAAFYAVDGKMVRHADMAAYCVLYVIICMVGLVVSVPYWQALGLFSFVG